MKEQHLGILQWLVFAGKVGLDISEEVDRQKQEEREYWRAMAEKTNIETQLARQRGQEGAVTELQRQAAYQKAQRQKQLIGTAAALGIAALFGVYLFSR